MTEAWSLTYLQRLYRRSAIFDWRMRQQPRPTPTHWKARDPWRGKANLGQPLVSGDHPLEHDGPDWHRFRWLRDMREFGGSQARTISRRVVMDWVIRNSRWSNAHWHPDIMADRLKTMVLLWGWYGESASLSQQQSLIASMAVQLHCLEKDWDGLASADARVNALSGIILTSLFLDPDADAGTHAATLGEEISNLVLGDGCHVSRRPDQHLGLLQMLIETRGAMTASLGWIGEAGTAHHKSIEDSLSLIEDTIIRMGSVGRMWRHVDGTLMAIRGSASADLDMAEQILAQAGPEGKVTHHAADSGFIRIASGRSVLMMNAAPPSWGASKSLAWGADHDAGALAIEFSNGQNRIIINAGPIDGDDNPALRQALASTAAHSTLTLDDTNSADISDGGSRQAQGSETESGPAEGGTLAVASHDGYEPTHALTHTRRIFLATGGYDLRGEDQLTYTGRPGSIPTEAVVRFHLHPKITPILSLKGDVTLRLPGSAAPWAFRSDGARVSVEDSIMMGPEGVEKTRAITLTVETATIRQRGEQSIRWGLRRVAKK